MSYLEDVLDGRKKKKQGLLDEKNLTEQRQKIIAFKKFFGEEHGRSVMLDLMNRFYVLQELPETSDPMAMARAEGSRDVVLYLLKRANTDVAKLDEIMKGNFV